MTAPDVVVIVADDLGFSDPSCYGGELRTPSLDRLAAEGAQLSQFYNGARCSPSRASLLTGLHPQQVGLGVLTNDDRPRGYPGTLAAGCATMAEILADAGFATGVVGKWHLASDVRRTNGAWPLRRGFDHFFGTLSGCGSYYDPPTLTRGETNAEADARDPAFFYTDAITDEAVAFVSSRAGARPRRPFFLYVAYTAPHWPLHAPDEDEIATYDGVFDRGWDDLRAARLERMRAAGVLGPETELSAADPARPTWWDARDRAWQLRRMQVYAAQVERMDRGIGRILDALEAASALDDALVVFLSDNGASPEELPLVELARFRLRADILRHRTRAGSPITIGNDPSLMPGPEDTFQSYGRAWANLSNTPFRRYKRWVHEGGICAPFIVRWRSGGIAEGRVIDAPFQLVDVLPTVLEATAATYPEERNGRPIPPAEGRSMLPALRGHEMPESSLFWEHTGNAAARHGRWKLVREHGRPWELYDLAADRSEMRDLARDQADLAVQLAAEWQAWAGRIGLIPWDVTLEVYRRRGLGEVDAAG
ncbi:MAG: arylsulfatase [Candidatus Limnocylindria bacterium]